MTSNFLYDFNFRDHPDLYDNTVARGHTERKSVGRSLAEGLMRPLRVTLTATTEASRKTRGRAGKGPEVNQVLEVICLDHEPA